MLSNNLDEIFQFLERIGKQQSILIAEDDIDSNKIQSQFLAKLYTTVDSAYDGEEALEKYKAKPYDIVITDICMPKLDGLELCKKIRAINPSQRIIVISAHNDFHFMQDAIKIGVNEYLLKPLDYNDFLVVLNRVSSAIEKDRIFARQTKLAAVGEIANNIANQWMQPLYALSAQALSLSATFELGELRQEHINEFTSSTSTILAHMLQTIDDFKNFTKFETEKRFFKLSDAIQSAYFMLKSTMSASNIEILLPLQDSDAVIFGFKSQFTYVLLNIINNAKDALIENGITNKCIIIDVDEDENSVIVQIQDNAGGIDAGIMDSIFQPYFTTKDGCNNSGIGLYISKNIIEINMDGKLNAKNIANGAVFEIVLQKQ